MGILTISAALNVAMACAPSVDPRMLVAIGRHESGLDPLTIHDNTTKQTLRGDSVSTLAPRLISAGHSIDLGLMQINSSNLGLLGLRLQDAFDPCRSIEAAAKLLTLFSKYNTGSPTQGIANGYATRVMANLDDIRAETIIADAIPQAPACEPTPDVWAEDPCHRDDDDAFTSHSEEDHDQK